MMKKYILTIGYILNVLKSTNHVSNEDKTYNI